MYRVVFLVYSGGSLPPPNPKSSDLLTAVGGRSSGRNVHDPRRPGPSRTFSVLAPGSRSTQEAIAAQVESDAWGAPEPPSSAKVPARDVAAVDPDGGLSIRILFLWLHPDQVLGLDYVISEAKKYGIYLVLSLVNNFESFGGRMQYIQWARDEGRHLSSDDDFYRDEVVKSYYKNHVRAILTRVNTITGVAYKDEAAIFAWELVNEPRCESDLSGRTLQAWIEDMAAHVKSIDSNHLLEVGLEGFYGETIPERKKINLGYELGTDFISNSQVEGIDFATIHAYPDMWMPGSTEQTQLAFLQSWIQSHVEDADAVLRKPLLISEFGKSSRLSNRTADEKAALYTTVYDAIYASARGGGACRGGIFWHLLLGVQEMEGLRDGYEVIFSESPSLGQIIANQSHRISNLNGGSETEKKLRPALPSGN
ncbi:Mannan endo-1,4-beta-mannosidase [Musa troglodytarum]|uniref:mannan endo-1,4-beta-mannosidase n=1 Tax=Musa troglodytarum TaxID=320322 RepID=A0A9E7FC64_9LILI|nr:Mannan endo-1,4-beta-mannosidase [Musa troglodytarum]